MAYSNITPPTLPEYGNELYTHYVLEFEYDNGAENWAAVSMRYSATPFTYNGAAVTNAGEHHLQTYGSGTGEWTYWGTLTELSIAPGVTATGGYRRIWTNHNILDGPGNVWLAANTATPAEANQDRLSIMKSKLAGLIMAWCAPVRQFPQREPIGYLYGHVAKEGKTPDVYIGDVGYMGAVLPQLPEWDKTKYPYALIAYYNGDVNVDGGRYARLICSSEPIHYACKDKMFGGYLLGVGFAVLGDVKVFGFVTHSEMWNWAFEVYDVPYPAANTWRSNVYQDRDGYYDERTVIFSDAPHVTSSPMLSIWANHDVYYSEDSMDYGGVVLSGLYHSASEPIPVSDIVAYNYNGPVMPELPKWDKGKYPYACIGVSNLFGMIYLYLTNIPLYANQKHDGSVGISSFGNKVLCKLYINLDLETYKPNGKWNDTGDDDDPSVLNQVLSPIWSNTDVYLITTDESGNQTLTDTVYLQASEPVPVYE